MIKKMNCLTKITEKAERGCRLLRKYKHSCPIELTAKCNNHFGIRRRDKGGEIAGMNMHGSFSVTLIELLLFGALTAFIITVVSMIGKISFKIRYKER